jgi:hypothetical protein
LVGVKFLAAIALTAVCVRLAAATAATDTALPVTFDNPHDGFSISFPSGWEEMVPQQLAEIDRAAAFFGFREETPIFHFGYQMTNSQGSWFPATVFVRVEESARYRDTNAILAELENKDVLPGGIRTESPIFDSERNAFILKGSARIAGRQAGEFVLVYFLTQKGAIRTFFILPLKSGNEVPVEQIVRGVRIHDWAKVGAAGRASNVDLWLALGSAVVIAVTFWRTKPVVAPFPETAVA